MANNSSLKRTMKYFRNPIIPVLMILVTLSISGKRFNAPNVLAHYQTSSQVNNQGFQISRKASSQYIAPGDLITYTFSITFSNSLTETTNIFFKDAILSNTIFINATTPHFFNGDTVIWQRDNMSDGDNWQVNLLVQAPVTATGTVRNFRYFVRSKEISKTKGPPIFIKIVPKVCVDSGEENFNRFHEIRRFINENKGYIETFFDYETGVGVSRSITNQFLTPYLPFARR